ncbi:MAG: DMT family transporter [Gammaproteobacteria bacterium]|nr:DMT family transporter [Gammaproteobacteria bacterium]
MSLKAVFYTILALIAFSANSIFCRMALGGQSIDAASFTIIRLLSGAITLGLILLLTHKVNSNRSKGSWPAALMLFIYALSFSYAYISLDAGTGALILFGSVQLSMITISLLSGTRLHYTEWLGVALAFCGFIYLILPGVSTPSGTGFLLMTVSGVAWGGYTLMGKGSESPLSDTGYNFIRTLPLVAIMLIIGLSEIPYSSKGITLAILSGAFASGIGYSIWYLALPLLTSTQAAVVQLTVPLFATLGGVLFLNELINTRLFISTALILGGILLVVLGRRFLNLRFRHIH